jgi:hypothetical protein
MRRKGDGLDRLFNRKKAAVVNEYREDDGEGEPCDEAVDTQAQGVSDDIDKIGGGKKPAKMIEPRPGAAPDPFHGLVVFEGHNDPVHGDVIENDYIDHRDKEEQVKIPVIPVELPET